jgi:acyl-CoA thioesterase FadM
MPPRLSDYASVGLAAAWRSWGRSPEPIGVYRGRVWPRYCDLNLHMNYGAYLEITELARLDWLVRTGLLRDWSARRWQAVVGSLDVQYRKELKPLQAFEVETRAVGFDRRAVVVEHLVRSAAGEHAALRLNVVVRRWGGGGVVDRAALEPTVTALLVSPS